MLDVGVNKLASAFLLLLNDLWDEAVFRYLHVQP